MSRPEPMPPLCGHHRGVYRTRMAALRRRFRYPGSGRKALAREAATVARQCRECLARHEKENTP